MKATVSRYMMGEMRSRLGDGPNDTSHDEEILKLSNTEFFEHWLNWQGLFGYVNSILDAIKVAYGIDLYKLEQVERKLEK